MDEADDVTHDGEQDEPLGSKEARRKRLKAHLLAQAKYVAQDGCDGYSPKTTKTSGQENKFSTNMNEPCQAVPGAQGLNDGGARPSTGVPGAHGNVFGDNRAANSFATEGPYPHSPSSWPPITNQIFPSVGNPFGYKPTSFFTGTPFGSKLSAHDKQVVSALQILEQTFWLVRNELKSVLLQERRSGEVLPATPEAIEDQLKLEFFNKFQQDLSSKAAKSALARFRISITPYDISPCFGRAGSDVERNRYIFLGHETIRYAMGDPTYEVWNQQQSHIEPKDSLPSAFNVRRGSTPAGLVKHLFEVTDIPVENDLLIIAWSILSWMPDQKQVLLELLGDTPFSPVFTQAAIKYLLDPATVLGSPQLPKNLKQLDDCALRNYLLSFDRVDEFSETIQQGLLQLLDGKAISWKSKPSSVPTEIRVVCPVMLNSLESVVSYKPLADRTLTIELSKNGDVAPVSFSDPATRTLLDDTFNGLLSVFGYVNSHWASVETDPAFERYGELSDLCRVGVLVARSLDRDDADFPSQLDMNQQTRREYELDEHPVAQALLRCFKDKGEAELEEAVKDWQELLSEYRLDNKQSDWPQTPRAMGAQFKIAAPILRSFGITLEPLGQRAANRRWRLFRNPSSEGKE
ncbi:hypothetical protein [Marinobacterium sedimentorum]|uniref:hypothetical protein n=1 Tax=Marinobacterium sedimentorum TaxID=2927804 RepID=UPI0020C6DE56|nr:hypothetical protein [Marinobacterium sedimentorum]MCP8687168.1 hypothetical protein [Marinobacterium sedimentorum]